MLFYSHSSNNACWVAGAQRVLPSRAHSTDPGAGNPATVAVNFISFMALSGRLGGLRNYPQEPCSRGTRRGAGRLLFNFQGHKTEEKM